MVKLSYFTPSHDPTFIEETYKSILAQQGDVPWEWIIVPNGPRGFTVNFPDEMQNHPNIRFECPTDDVRGIGALKRYACSLCTGDVLIELDHDDILSPNFNLQLANAYERQPGGFYYSDFINFMPNGTCEVYGGHYGWLSYPTNVDGKNYKAMRAFEPSARSLCQIFYAPNHVRAWSREAYDKVGGHNKDMFVADDHDLVCRTYLAGVPFVWIREPIYLYRRHKRNSFLEYNKQIQTGQNDNTNKYLHALVDEEARRKQWHKVDLGRRNRAQQGYTSCDLVANGFDWQNWFPDNSVGVFRCVDFFQRIPQNQIVEVMNRLYDALVPGGWILSSTPSVDDGQGRPGRGVFQDPTHRSYWSQNNFWYFTDKKFGELVDERRARFQSVRLWTDYPSHWHKENCIPYVFADLVALKGQRQPGLCKI